MKEAARGPLRAEAVLSATKGKGRSPNPQRDAHRRESARGHRSFGVCLRKTEVAPMGTDGRARITWPSRLRVGESGQG